MSKFKETIQQILASNLKFEVEIVKVRNNLYVWKIKFKKTTCDEETTPIADGMADSLERAKEWIEYYRGLGYDLPQMEDKELCV
jgi:hypothetical protein